MKEKQANRKPSFPIENSVKRLEQAHDFWKQRLFLFI